MENSRDNNETINKLVISKLVGYINLTIKLIDDMCDYIYKGQGNKIFDNLDQFINGLDFILSKSAYISNDIDIKRIDAMLINIEKAISIKDYILLTDVLLYELKPTIQRWIEILETRYENK